VPQVRKIKMAQPNVAGYVFESKVGSGTFAYIYKTIKNSHISSKQVTAIKCISKKKLSSTAVDNIVTEIKLLQILKYPHIVEMLDFQWDVR